jgi:hypothetical protein
MSSHAWVIDKSSIRTWKSRMSSCLPSDLSCQDVWNYSSRNLCVQTFMHTSHVQLRLRVKKGGGVFKYPVLALKLRPQVCCHVIAQRTRAYMITKDPFAYSWPVSALHRLPLPWNFKCSIMLQYSKIVPTNCISLDSLRNSIGFWKFLLNFHHNSIKFHSCS